MKFLSSFLTIILIWLMIDEFFLKKNEIGKKYSIVGRWKELGARIHSVIGTLAVAIVIIYFVRLFTYVFF